MWFDPYLDGSRPWLDRESFHEKPTGSHYAVRHRDGSTETFDTSDGANQALNADHGKGQIRGVATPEYDRFFPKLLLQPPHPEDEDRIKRALLGDVKQGLLYSLFIGVLFFANIPGLQLTPSTKMLAILLLFLFGIAPAINSGFQWLEISKKRTDEEKAQRRANEVLFSHWIQSFPRWPVYSAIGLLVAMFLVQVFHNGMITGLNSYFQALGESYREAGLLRMKVRYGNEWWRIITAGLLHGGMIHLYFNSRALLSISSVLLGICRMSWIVIVFTLSVIGGSLASIYGVTRFAPSVGASGGIMGLLGFLLVLSYFYKGGLPHFIKSSVVSSVILIGILGWMAKDFIDNAAHAGGLGVGVVCGLIVAPLSDILLGKDKTPAYIFPAAGACALVILFGAIKIITLLLQS